MEPLNMQYHVLEVVVERLKRMANPVITQLYGITYTNNLIVVGVGMDPAVVTARASTSSIQLISSPPPHDPEPYPGPSSQPDQDIFDKHHLFFPGGIDYVGCMYCTNELMATSREDIIRELKDVHVTTYPICIEKNDEELTMYYVDNNLMTPITYDIVTLDNYNQMFCHLTLTSNMNIRVPVDNIPTYWRIMKMLAQQVSTGMIFQFQNTDYYITPLTQSHAPSTLGELFDTTLKEKDFKTGLEVLRVNGSLIHEEPQPELLSSEPIAAYLIQFASTEELLQEDTGPVSSAIRFDPYAEEFLFDIKLPIDAICVAYRKSSMEEVYKRLIDATHRILYQIARFLNELRQNDDVFGFYPITACHFLPKEIAHPVTIIKLTEEKDIERDTIRKFLHECFHLGSDRPIFTNTLTLKFIDSSYRPIPLMNVHEGLRGSGLVAERSLKSLVKGHYKFYHYNQDIEDSGWGCAYRSLQTIMSWFILQGYSDNDVWSHDKIQEELVLMGDKPHSFRGSKTWIGTLEGCLVLQQFISDIDCQIQNVSSGADLNTLAPVLFNHFEYHGTPVMIGGNLMAYTILGVEFNEDNLDTKFLVLDPHYLGEDQLEKIQVKGGIGWKGMDFWNQKTFYNLCLPRRPRYY